MNLEGAIHKQTNGTVGNIYVFLQFGVSEKLLLWTDLIPTKNSYFIWP